MKKIVVLTGAGISQESGISTFRDSDGLWENYPVSEIANYDSWERNEEQTRGFYNMLLKKLIKAQPNEGHKQLVRLEERYDVTIITQNIDDLHERAGSKKIIHLHGELKKACSVTDNSEVYPIKGDELKKSDVDKNGKPLRPFIVWFGEAVPMIEPAIKECEKADIFIVVGTSLVVYPAAGLLNYAKPGCKKYLVDPKRPNADLSGITFIEEKASTGVKKVVDELLKIN
ncbi:MAG: NAD-dependent deacylase [Bacteroidales bacterium]|jgi:NAD-dependent deacetylase|nr:NAD-dependent deacylase [Bacteroidales bacterium]